MLTDTKTTALPHDPALAELWRIVEEIGTQQAAADKLEVHPTYLGRMLNGKDAISETVLKKIGYIRLVVNVKEVHSELVVSAIENALRQANGEKKLLDTARRIKAVKS